MTNEHEFLPELVIFDCDGVLIDSEIISATTLINLLEPFGIEIDLPHIQDHFIGRSFPTVAALICARFELELPDSFEHDYRRALLIRFENELECTAGVASVLENMSVPFCVATSSSPQRVARSLEITGLEKYFHTNIYTASEVKNGKPAPDLFLHVAQRESVNPDRCLVIEDSLPGIEAAKSAGMKVLRYVGGSHFANASAANIDSRENIIGFDSWAKFFDIVPRTKTSLNN